MIFVFDTSMFIHLYENYYPAQFPSLWKKFDELVDKKQIVSVLEVYEEINTREIDSLQEWSKKNKDIF